jgi:hypothetical protein
MTSAKFYANMKWFDVAEQPSGFGDLPSNFSEAHKLWAQSKQDNIEEVLKLLSPYVRARLVLSNIMEWENLFDEGLTPNDGIVESESVNVVGIDFTNNPIPVCKAEAFFRLDLRTEMGNIELNDWQEENSCLADAVVFYWDIPRTESTEDLDFTFGDNQGVEFMRII